MSFCIPEEILGQHTAIVGKTGAGKTSTEKLIVEHVYDAGFRVCVLDTIKSDWWGITSNHDGTKAGLDFKILGGPRGHVPLHANAGKVIGQLVGSGKLRHSIIDMADFEAGGIQKFFVDFAPSLMRNAKGVLYLVIEEAHELAPKERAGFGQESMAIHWAKKLATAGRSKGIRLIVATQRVQSLHNAVLGSCETIIAHRLTTPADQEPIVKWLKANTTKETSEAVANSMSSLTTGKAWVCSGEAKFFKEVQFPKFRTYDNTATPTGDGTDVHVKTAPVDSDELKAIIGEAVKEALATDPKELQKEISRLKAQLAKQPIAASPVPVEPVSILTDEDRKLLNRVLEGGCDKVIESFEKLQAKQVECVADMKRFFEPIKQKLSVVERPHLTKYPAVLRNKPQTPRLIIQPRSEQPSTNGNGELNKAQRTFLTVLANRCDKTTTRNQLAVFSGYSATSGHVDNVISSLRTPGYLTGTTQALGITDSGISAIEPFDKLPTGQALRNHWKNHLESGPSKMLAVLEEVYPNEIGRDELAERSGFSVTSGHVDNCISALRTRELITGSKHSLKMSDDLFEE